MQSKLFKVHNTSIYKIHCTLQAASYSHSNVKMIFTDNDLSF
uniref:Uncharacterized protein n=1 Tax=Anguilla anguilla TaxID=7936 RepID=A0A0E9U219_ANGAN